MSAADDWTTAIEDQREQKDRFFAEHPHSPLPPDHREGFDGLAYYPPDPSLRFELPLHEHDEKELITVETTAGGVREYRRWGEFRFEVGGERLTLQAYKADADEDRLWVPFRDETSGEETYAAGRYLDLELQEHRADADAWVLDFNLAYNPYCAYSEVYECPLIPMENWLDVPIRAGERTYEPPVGTPSHEH